MSLLSRLFGSKGDSPPAESGTAEPLVIVPIPPLVDVLRQLEDQKGEPLTEDEVVSIAEGAICMTMAQSRAAKMAEARAYADINPAHAWEEWQQVRSLR